MKGPGGGGEAGPLGGLVASRAVSLRSAMHAVTALAMIGMPCVSPSVRLSVPSCCLRVLMCAQVFRTYNASITLDKLLFEMEEGGGVGHHGEPYCNRTLEAKKADYDRANKEVGWCCGFVVTELIRVGC